MAGSKKELVSTGGWIVRYLKAYVEHWGQFAVIVPMGCLGRTTGCFSDCPVKKCAYRRA